MGIGSNDRFHNERPAKPGCDVNGWQRWLRAPKTHLLNRMLFQVHLWCGIALGAYVLMISLSGVAFLLEDELDRMFVPGNVTPTADDPLSGDALDGAIETVYSDSEVFMISPSSNPRRAVRVVLRRDGEVLTHYFNPYSGEDQGSADPWQASVYGWLIDFHDDLFMGRQGRILNGWGSIAFLLMMLSGLVIWWRGRAQWHQGFYLTAKSPRGMLWQLHSVFGFWCLLFMFAWGFSGILLTMPDVIQAVTPGMDSGLAAIRDDRGSGFLDFVVDVHFGRFDGAWVPWLLAAVGMVPVMLFITGFILWWKRVVRRAWRGLVIAGR